MRRSTGIRVKLTSLFIEGWLASKAFTIIFFNVLYINNVYNINKMCRVERSRDERVSFELKAFKSGDLLVYWPGHQTTLRRV